MKLNFLQRMANEIDNSDQIRNDEIFALSEIFYDTCQKVDKDVLNFEICEPEFNEKKVKFQVRFIENYPKNTRPDYTIIADWIPNSIIESIKNKFNKLWSDNENEPIVYLWIEALKEEILKWLENEEAEVEIDEKIDEQINQKMNEIEVIKKQFNKMSVKKYKESTLNEERFHFIHGEPLIVKKSVFQAHLLKIDDETKITMARAQLMNENKRVQEATHNIMAYRLIKTIDGRTIEHSNYDDDGETQAGGRLHMLLQLTDSKNVLVVVSRYFGGTKLGPDRFKFINQVAKEVLMQESVICPKEDKQQKNKKKK